MRDSTLFFASSFPVKNEKGLLKNTFIHTPKAEAARGFSTYFQILPAQKFDLALARWLVAAGGWSSETINHRNAARWSWMVPSHSSQPSLAASPGPANFAGKTFQQNLPFAASVHSDGDTESPS